MNRIGTLNLISLGWGNRPAIQGKCLYLTADERQTFIATAAKAERPARTFCAVLPAHRVHPLTPLSWRAKAQGVVTKLIVEMTETSEPCFPATKQAICMVPMAAAPLLYTP